MVKTSRTVVLFVALLALFAPVASANSVTIAWDANTEADLAGYKVFWGLQSGTYMANQQVGNVTSWTVSGLDGGKTYYFAVQAVNAEGLASPYSQEVSITLARTGATGETEAEWMTRFSIADLAGDDDKDGVTNEAEFVAGTDPTLPNTWFLAEGATGFFKTRLAIANPGSDTAEITVTFLRQGLTPIARDYTIEGLSRTTIDLGQIEGLEQGSMSAQITTSRGGVVVERTMNWGGTGGIDAGHTGKAVARPSSTWYFAEGDARTFDTYLLLANTGNDLVTVDVEYLLSSGKTIRDLYLVGAQSRYTVHTNNVPGLAGTSFAMTVVASAPIIAERAMYFSTVKQWWKGGHGSAGVEAPATQWFIAEGHTGTMFDEFILLANPNGSPATATVRFLRPEGDVITKTYELAATSRTSIHVNSIPGLQTTDVSASISATLPIVAERSMYWTRRNGAYYEGHNSTAIAELGTKWALAEGQTGGPANFESYLLLANPNDQDASVTLTVVRDNQPPVLIHKTVRASSRLTVSSKDLPLTSGEQFGFVVESTNGIAIAVERSMYWDVEGLHWAGGSNETGTRIR